MNNIWTVSNQEKFEWVKKFKDIFINQKKDSLEDIFNKIKFGIHNSFSMEEYCSYELEEFALKCEKFNLTMEAEITCYDLKDNFFYFSLGKKEDKAVFEAIFSWDSITKKALGNQYNFKIEPKTQFIKNLKSNTTETFRRINIKPQINNEIHKVISLNQFGDCNLYKITLEDYLGGCFYNFNYYENNDNKLTYWNKINIYADSGKHTYNVLMRGEDHPLFIPNLFPKLNNDLLSFNISSEVFPVIIYVLTVDGQEHFFKYPIEKNFFFNSQIVNVCLTDNLSFDWIINTQE